VTWAPLDSTSVVIDLNGRSVVARLASAPTVESAVRHAGHVGSSSQTVTAPMPGNVLSVRVSEGDDVEAGQVLVVLEAMKMENTVPAPGAGRVARVLVKSGQQVQRGESLVELA
jgi:biotin carboxyl carrier protein